MKKFLAFDIETANTDEVDSDGDFQALRPLGIACATALAQDTDKPFVWHGITGRCQERCRISYATLA